MITRRTFLAGLAASPAVSGAGTLPLIDDPWFERGVKIWQNTPGAHKLASIIKGRDTSREPYWGVAQWYSRFDLATAKPEVLPSGSRRFFDGAKAVTFGIRGSEDADLILALNGRTEYGDRAPEKGQPWPHLLVEQQFVNHPKLTELKSVAIRIGYRLLKSEPYHLPGWEERRHTAQFQLFITVRNGNRSSPGFGDYLWFGVPMYDARYRLPIRHTAADKGSALKRGTGKFIFNPGGEQYATRPAADGEWVTIDRDLLPLMFESLETAWKAGFLPDSHERGDYQLGGCNLGWEVTGPLDVAMQIRGFGLEGVLADRDQA